jgi:hypothetical protein
VVSTTKGAEGIDCINGKDILIADTPETFVMQIDRLMKERQSYNKLRKNARSLVEKRYGYKLVCRRLSQRLESDFS